LRLDTDHNKNILCPDGASLFEKAKVPASVERSGTCDGCSKLSKTPHRSTLNETIKYFKNIPHICPKLKPQKVAAPSFDELTTFMATIPAIKPGIGQGQLEDGNWWVKFQIDITHELAWQVVQELGCIVNYISINERLPTVFYPVSPAPYLNGGPTEFLSWVIESKEETFLPSDLKEWLEGRLPNPVDDLEQWSMED
jgi:hypothetical protein